MDTIKWNSNKFCMMKFHLNKKKKDVNKEKRRKCSRVQNDLTIYTLLRNT